MIAVAGTSLKGAHGVYDATYPVQIRVKVTGDEGGFEVWGWVEDGGVWRAEWPAELASGTYKVRAELWRRVAHETALLKP